VADVKAKTQAEVFQAEINRACDELKTAGMPHALDLAKHIVRMKKELRFYNRFHDRKEDSHESTNGACRVKRSKAV